jgi:hypothetical protein
VLISLDLRATGPLYISSPEHFNFKLFKAFFTHDKSLNRTIKLAAHAIKPILLHTLALMLYYNRVI